MDVENVFGKVLLPFAAKIAMVAVKGGFYSTKTSMLCHESIALKALPALLSAREM